MSGDSDQALGSPDFARSGRSEMRTVGSSALPRIASRKFVTACLTRSVTEFFLSLSFRSFAFHKVEGSVALQERDTIARRR